MVHWQRVIDDNVYHYDVPVVDHHQYEQSHCMSTITDSNSLVALIQAQSLAFPCYLTITPEDVIKIVQVEDVWCVGVIEWVWWLYCGWVVQVGSIPASVTAALVHSVVQELHANDGEGVVDDADEEEDIEEAWSEGHHGVHQVSIPTLQPNKSARTETYIYVN